MNDSEIGQLWKWSLCNCQKLRAGHGIARRLITKLVETEATKEVLHFGMYPNIHGTTMGDCIQERIPLVLKKFGIPESEFKREAVE